jgi:hypothetical protein
MYVYMYVCMIHVVHVELVDVVVAVAVVRPAE